MIQGFNTSLTMLGGSSQNSISSQDNRQNFDQDNPAPQNELDDDIPF